MTNTPQAGRAERRGDTGRGELAHVDGDAKSHRCGALGPAVGRPPQFRIVSRVVGPHQEIDPAEPVTRGAHAGVLFLRLRMEPLSIGPHFHVANGLGIEARMAGADSLLGFPKQTHEVRHGREAVRAEAHLYVDSAVGGRLGEDIRHTSDE